MFEVTKLQHNEVIVKSLDNMTKAMKRGKFINTSDIETLDTIFYYLSNNKIELTECTFNRLSKLYFKIIRGNPYIIRPDLSKNNKGSSFRFNRTHSNFIPEEDKSIYYKFKPINSALEEINLERVIEDNSYMRINIGEYNTLPMNNVGYLVFLSRYSLKNLVIFDVLNNDITNTFESIDISDGYLLISKSFLQGFSINLKIENNAN